LKAIESEYGSIIKVGDSRLGKTGSDWKTNKTGKYNYESHRKSHREADSGLRIRLLPELKPSRTTNSAISDQFTAFRRHKHI